MSALYDLFLKSQKNRVVEARQIPQQAVNFVDRANEYSDNFKTFTDRGKGTQYTEKALNFYDKELNDLTPPGDFTQLELDIPLMRWNASKPYYSPGQANS